MFHYMLFGKSPEVVLTLCHASILTLFVSSNVQDGGSTLDCVVDGGGAEDCISWVLAIQAAILMQTPSASLRSR